MFLVKSKDDHYNNVGIKLLTKDKIYEVNEGLIRSSTYYYLSDDTGNTSFWSINRFITISEHRDIIIKNIIK